MPNMEISENVINACIADTDVLKSFELQAKSQGNIYAQVVLMKVHEALKIDNKSNNQRMLKGKTKSYKMSMGA